MGTLLATLGLTLAAQTPAGAQQIAWTACGDTNDFACGHLTVPLDPAGSSQDTITLAMRRHLAPVGPAKDALIALAGGPGQAAIPISERFDRLLGSVADTRDLIVFDQRGTGLSHPLSCAAFEHLVGHQMTPPAIGICAGQMGGDRAFFTTADTVADIEAIRQAGGYEKLVLYGTSYGTKVAERYAQVYPTHVEALVLDSVVPPNGPDPLRRDTFSAIPRVLRALCGSGACARVTPDPVADLAQLVRMSARRPIRARTFDEHGRPRSVSVSSNDLLAVLYGGDFDPYLRTEFPAAVRSAVHGDTAALGRMVARAEGEETEEEPESITEGFDSPLFFATTCEEQLFPWNRASTPSQRLREAAAYARSLPVGTFLPFTAANALFDGPLPCAYWPFATAAPEEDNAPLPSVPTLIFSGEYDIRTPTSGAQALAGSIPGAQLVVVPHTGHSVLSSALDSCPEHALQAFFAGHSIKPCGGRAAPPYPALDPLAPTRLALVSPVGGGGVQGRALHAVTLTLQDFDRDSTLQFFARVASRRVASALLDNSVGGLRGGWGSIGQGKISLHGYCYVPGIALSGKIGEHGGKLRVTGGPGVRGTLTLDAHGRLRGVLGARQVSTTIPLLLS